MEENFQIKKKKKEIQKLPFKIKANNGDSPEIEITLNGNTKKCSPVEISSFIIKKNDKKCWKLFK